MFDVHRAPLSKRSDRLMTNGEYLLNSFLGTVSTFSFLGKPWSSDLVTITKATLEPKTLKL